ncbi:DUF6414 family protein [Schleiferilactobacillus perolens]|jgi:hypothetical protein|uniref:DUF6414 family protein n=1 Tax=Schleiferilactobacillus perolens TaxID=100468 RepID=UPI0023550B8D|nr:DUF6414 family protein [Schleiferilactobacillus perolens]MCI2171559.1 DUF6414 family protein [Schleiferilactobacillus perolens]
MTKQKNIEFKKLVFFDEQAALDLLTMTEGGSVENVIKKVKNIAASVEATGEAGVSLWSALKIRISGNTKANVTDLAETQVKSTILTNFLELVEKLKNSDEVQLVDLKTTKLYLTDDSAAYFRTLSRYLRMVKDVNLLSEDMDTAEEQKNVQTLRSFNLSNMDEILDEATGYYQFIGVTTENETKESIIRFNYEGIRNNYKLTDLTKMDLRLIGIKVGNVGSLDISLTSDVLKSDENGEDYSGRDFIEENKKSDDDSETTKRYDVIDVVIAGVK